MRGTAGSPADSVLAWRIRLRSGLSAEEYFEFVRNNGGFKRTRVPLLAERSNTLLKGLILAQNERWRRGLGMQVERIPPGLLGGGSGERGSKAWATCPGDGDSLPNGRVIPDDVSGRHRPDTKRTSPREGPTCY